ncbi:MAG: MopE-related protein, partial [Planctomycetota bacterium]
MMRATRLAVLFLAALPLAGTGCNDQPDDASQSCQSSDDCAQGDICQEGRCVTSLSTSGDADFDGLSDDAEGAVGTDPTEVDTDGDGETDPEEVGENPSEPLDVDGDGIPDALEPENVDSDGDGIDDEHDPCNEDINCPVPQIETCDGDDDDADGAVDENVDSEAIGLPCTVGEGACAAEGRTICNPALGDPDAPENTPRFICDVEAGAPAEEICDGVDNDCDGRVDNTFDGLGDACEAGDGACRAEGVYVCSEDGGSVVCSARAGEPGAELCGNEADDDCDGQTDEGFVGLGEDCAVGAGVCAGSGVNVCAEDGLSVVCDAEIGEPNGDESCNGLDDDCDGSTDEAWAELGTACEAGVGACAVAGTVVCAEGGAGTACDAVAAEPGEEVCNGVDDDCDGVVDGQTRPCYGGPEGTDGVGICVGGTQTCVEGNWGICGGQVEPADAEACDGNDRDCDGTVDEGFPDTDADGDADCVDGDDDGDTIADDDDNCPLAANGDQADLDGDGDGDICDRDDDGDGVD